MESRENEESIIQNLKDAGCNAETIENFMAALREGNQAHGLKQLAAYRQTLLDVIHQEQKYIDCLDYLVYQMQKTEKRSV